MNSINQFGLGTAAIGRPQYINVRQETLAPKDLKTFKQKGFNILEKAYQSGICYFDTAPGYGMAEQLLLEWLKTKNDASIKVATKWGYTYVADFNPNAKVHEIKEHSLHKLNEQWEVSKAFLPNLEVYQIHSATFQTGVLENEAILNRLAFLKNEHGLKIGITTTGANQVEVIKEALDVAVEDCSLFDAFQVTYNVLDQSLKQISDTLVREGKMIIIKEALANGRLFRNENYEHYNDLYDYMEQLASKYDVGVDAIAINFCTEKIPKSIVLSGASNNKHIDDNVKAITFKLTETELDKLATFKINEEMYWAERKQLGWT